MNGASALADMKAILITIGVIAICVYCFWLYREAKNAPVVETDFE